MPISPNLNNNEVDKFQDLNTPGNTVVKTNPQLLQLNTFQAVTTEVGTTATKIEFPDEGTEFMLYHHAAGSKTVSLGPDNTIIFGGPNTAPLEPFLRIHLVVPEGNANNIFGVVQSGTIDVFVIGFINQ